MKITSKNQLANRGMSPVRGGHGALGQKKLIVFDLDGTLAPTKSIMDKEMSGLMADLLKKKKVAVIGGGKWDIFHFQLLDELKVPKNFLCNLYLFPTTATAFYKYQKGWKTVYAHKLTAHQVKKITAAFEQVFQETGYKHPKKIYGELIENRGSQVSFSFLGQDVVKVLGKKGIKMKVDWKKRHTPLKLKIAKAAQKYLPEFEVHAAGFTTIDVTQKGIDKAYGLRQIEKHLGVKIKDMLFIGDAIFPGGNDYAIVRTGVDYMPVKGPKDTKKIIRGLLN